MIALLNCESELCHPVSHKVKGEPKSGNEKRTKFWNWRVKLKKRTKEWTEERNCTVELKGVLKGGTDASTRRRQSVKTVTWMKLKGATPMDRRRQEWTSGWTFGVKGATFGTLIKCSFWDVQSWLKRCMWWEEILMQLLKAWNDMIGNLQIQQIDWKYLVTSLAKLR